ncbi:unnamed protein product [Prorocentrum cordatum]|uniref:Ion transport domain-containing protein n=1 Tax=Prorocentrum cordatum TaxID=2364126 RepID=A0ABN9X2Q1_9DINO|nr:unnamed protein product [Polarella glacialis]
MARKPQRGPYLALIDRECRDAEPMGWWTHQEYVFDELFLKKLWHKAQELGYFTEPVKGGGKKLHVTIFRHFFERFHDLLDEKEPTFDVEQFGAATSSAYLTWTDLRKVLEAEGDADSRLPRVRLTFAEQCNCVFDGRCASAFDGQQGQGQGESYLSWSVGLVIFIAIIMNVIQIFGGVAEWVGDVCALIFTIEYVCKFAVAPFCRYGIFNEDWLLETVVPDPKDTEHVLPAGMTSSNRLAKFFFTPMNLIDLLSILPTLVEPVIKLLAGSSEDGGMNLTFLRALRLFRIFRILKFGKFSSTLTVLGVTIGNSVQAIGVLCLYILMIAMLAGAVIQQFENPGDTAPEDEELAKAFGNVPMAMKWVAGRMVTMQHSLPEKKALPQHLGSAFIVIFLGLFKGVIFVLPIATITTAYRAAESKNKSQQNLQREVADNRITPLGTEWSKDPNAPAARVEIRGEADHDSPLIAIGSFNLPFFREGARPCDVKFWVPLVGSLKGMFRGHPGVEVRVTWQADEASRPSERLPKGRLTVRVISGANFAARAGARWHCVVEVPVKLYPEDEEDGQSDHLLRREYRQTGGDGSSPDFDTEQDFAVWWEDKGSSKQSPEEWRRQVLEMLQQQGQKLDTLQSRARAQK